MTQPIEEFHFEYRETGQRLTWCRSCMAVAKRAWYLRNTEHQKERVKANRARAAAINQDAVWGYLATHPCVDCGESDPVVLQFDHLADKREGVGQMVRGFTWAQIEAEIAKCVVRCGNCHRRKTAREQGIYDAKHAFMRLEDEAVAYRLFDN